MRGYKGGSGRWEKTRNVEIQGGDRILLAVVLKDISLGDATIRRFKIDDVFVMNPLKRVDLAASNESMAPSWPIRTGGRTYLSVVVNALVCLGTLSHCEDRQYIINLEVQLAEDQTEKN